MALAQPASRNLIAQLIAQRQAADANWAKLSQTPFDRMGQARPFTATQQAAVNRTLGSAAALPAASVPAASVPTLEAVGAAASKLPVSGVGPSSTLPTLRTVGAAAQGLKPFGVGPSSLLAAETPVALAGTAGAAGARQGLMATARGALGGGLNAVKAGGFKGALLPGAIALGGSMAGGALDESQMLGGSESKLNDTASKVLKWGGTGAAIGSVVPGVGTLLGAGIGGVIGVAHEGLERNGVLGTASKEEQANILLNESTASATKIGLPAEVTGLLQAQYNAGLEFAKTPDEKLALAQQYATQVQEQAMAFAANPEAFASSEQTAENEAANMLIQRSVMMNAVKPYADNFLAQSNAQADMYQNMAAGAGDMAPAYEQMAAQTRASGARNAMGVVAETQMTPYQMALEKQAGYLNQMSSNLVSQAMSQVGQQQPAAGSTDLTALIDQMTAGQP